LRQVIVLRDIYDLPHGSIATELGISEAAAKVRLHRARRRLRELLAPDFADGSDSADGSDFGGGSGDAGESRDARAS